MNNNKTVIEDELKRLFELKSGSVRAFAIEADIPYTTLRSILERGVMKANVENIFKISNTLEVTIEDILYGEQDDNEKLFLSVVDMEKIKKIKEEHNYLLSNSDVFKFLLNEYLIREEKKEKNKDFTGTEAIVINHAKNMTPVQYLKSIKDQKNRFVSNNEIWVLKEISEHSSLSNEVINILLHYILVVKDSSMLERKYAMTIANDWEKRGIQTSESAVQNIKKMYSRLENKNI